jgi:6-phosphogluconolactonase
MIQVCADSDRLSQSAAELFVESARQAVAAQGRFCVALAGGSTPRHSYQRLAHSPFLEQVPWAKVHVFWGDERCVSTDDPRNNARMARETLLNRVPLPADQIHPMACSRDPEAAALAYQTLLRTFFFPKEPRFDLILLGLGEDGHTASLFPGTPALQESVRLVTPAQSPGEEITRLTLTVPIINLARLVVFLVSGRRKSEILRQVLKGPVGRYPAQLINPKEGEVLWLVDKDAAEQDIADSY